MDNRKIAEEIVHLYNNQEQGKPTLTDHIEKALDEKDKEIVSYAGALDSAEETNRQLQYIVDMCKTTEAKYQAVREVALERVSLGSRTQNEEYIDAEIEKRIKK